MTPPSSLRHIFTLYADDDDDVFGDTEPIFLRESSDMAAAAAEVVVGVGGRVSERSGASGRRRKKPLGWKTMPFIIGTYG